MPVTEEAVPVCRGTCPGSHSPSLAGSKNCSSFSMKVPTSHARGPGQLTLSGGHYPFFLSLPAPVPEFPGGREGRSWSVHLSLPLFNPPPLQGLPCARPTLDWPPPAWQQSSESGCFLLSLLCAPALGQFLPGGQPRWGLYLGRWVGTKWKWRERPGRPCHLDSEKQHRERRMGPLSPGGLPAGGPGELSSRGWGARELTPSQLASQWELRKSGNSAALDRHTPEKLEFRQQ